MRKPNTGPIGRRRIAAKVAMLLMSLLMVQGGLHADELPVASPESVGMSSERLARIRPAMQAYIDASLTPGDATAILRRGQLVHFEVQGHIDVAAGKALQPDTIFRIASMTKPITSVALMMLWEEGRFQLRDPVSKFIPEFADVKVSTTGDASAASGELVAPNRAPTIRDMLTHTAGLANNYIGNPDASRQLARVRPDDTLESLIKRLAAAPLD